MALDQQHRIECLRLDLIRAVVRQFDGPLDQNALDDAYEAIIEAALILAWANHRRLYRTPNQFAKRARHIAKANPDAF
jgi:hypothetical protein